MSDVYDDSEQVAGSSLEAEFDAAFDGDERASAFLKLTSDAFSREFKKIEIKDIGFTDPVKKGRQRTMSGLTAIVGDLGVLTPIHVMTVEDPDDDYKYVLLEGLRRVYAAAKNGFTDIDAIVWDFKDKDQGSEVALYLTLILNRVQRRNWSEIWHLYQVLEMKNAMTPGTLEYLLQLEPGEAMKLKDVMLCEYDEVKEALINNEKDLEGCYKMLAKLRKEEDKLAKDDATGADTSMDGVEDIVSDDERQQLEDSDVQELLGMADDLDDMESLEEEDFDDMNQSSFGVEQQKVGDRHPLDPALRQAVLARDRFTCRCCGMKLIGARLGLIAVHHIIPVHCNGRDSIDNLVTLDVGCHVALHVMERNGGSIMMSQKDYEELPENEQLSLKKALKLARIAIEADKRRGMSKEDVAKATQDSIRHPMPGVGLKENQIMYASTQNAMANSENASGDEEEDEASD